MQGQYPYSIRMAESSYWTHHNTQQNNTNADFPASICLTNENTSTVLDGLICDSKGFSGGSIIVVVASFCNWKNFWVDVDVVIDDAGEKAEQKLWVLAAADIPARLSKVRFILLPLCS